MQSKITLFIIALFFPSFLVSCNESKQCASEESAQVEPINPNGDSELALLMRAMFDDAMQMKKQVANGQPVTSKLDYEKILTAHATQPEKAASPEYKAFATGYLQTMKALETATPQQASTIYDNMVENCMACHQVLCPGPMVKIRKLRE